MCRLWQAFLRLWEQILKRINKSTLEIDPRGIKNPVASYELVRHMRASYYLLGALLGKFNSAEVAMPGGCDFGVRPIDLHLKKALKLLVLIIA